MGRSGLDFGGDYLSLARRLYMGFGCRRACQVAEVWSPAPLRDSHHIDATPPVVVPEGPAVVVVDHRLPVVWLLGQRGLLFHCVEVGGG